MSTETKDKVEVTAENIHTLTKEQRSEFIKNTTIESEKNGLEEAVTDSPEPDEAAVDETGKSEEGTQEPWTPPTKEEYETLLKQVKHQKSLIGRQSNEVGSLRKMVKELTAEEKEKLNEDYFDDPAGMTEAVMKLQEQKALEEAQAEQEKLQYAKQWLETVMPDIHELDLTQEMAEDGLTPEEQAAFDRTRDPIVAYQLAKRAKMRARLAELESKLAETTQSAEEIAKNIEKAAKSKRAVKPREKTTSDIDALGEPDFSKMTRAERQEWLKLNAHKGWG